MATDKLIICDSHPNQTSSDEARKTYLIYPDSMVDQFHWVTSIEREREREIVSTFILNFIKFHQPSNLLSYWFYINLYCITWKTLHNIPSNAV